MKKLFKSVSWVVCFAVLASALWLGFIYSKGTPGYLSKAGDMAVMEPLRNSMAGLTLGDELSGSKLKSCAQSAPPCLWELEEYEKVVLKKSPASSDSPYKSLPGWDTGMNNYFRPKAPSGVLPKRVPKSGDRGPSSWFVIFDSDRPLGWRGLEVKTFTCNDIVQSVTLSVPLVAEGRNAIAPLLKDNPIFDVALQWYGKPDSTELRRVGFKDWAQPWNTSPLFKLQGQTSDWYGLTHRASYSWREGDQPNFREKARHTIHSITLTLPSKPCPSPAAVAEQEHEQAYLRKQQDALRKYKERDDKAISNDNQLFQ